MLDAIAAGLSVCSSTSAMPLPSLSIFTTVAVGSDTSFLSACAVTLTSVSLARAAPSFLASILYSPVCGSAVALPTSTPSTLAITVAPFSALPVIVVNSGFSPTLSALAVGVGVFWSASLSALPSLLASLATVASAGSDGCLPSSVTTTLTVLPSSCFVTSAVNVPSFSTLTPSFGVMSFPCSSVILTVEPGLTLPVTVVVELFGMITTWR